VDLRALGQQAMALHQQGRLGEAEALYRQIIAAAPNMFPALFLLGALRLESGDSAQAVELIGRALAINPDDPAAQAQYGLALVAENRIGEALPAFHQALALQPGFLPARLGRGAALRRLGRLPEALADYDAALAADPGNADAWNERGSLLRQLHRMDEALESFSRAIALWPDFADAWNNRGDLQWSDKTDYRAAVADLSRAIVLDPERPWLRGNLLHLKMIGADWNGVETEIALVHEGVRAGKPVVQPFVYQAIAEHPKDSQACSRIWVRENFPNRRPAPPPWRGHDRIRVGYVSSDFREQAVGFLLAGVYECHDKNRFEIIGVNSGGPHQGAMRRRMVAAFDKFIDITALSAEQAAARVKAEEIDILVDLNGYYGTTRSDMFMLRPAPVQVSYMGFPATLGAPYIDYVLADRIVIPEEERCFYDEQVVYLPETYWVNDSKRAIGDMPLNRADYGLPSDAFVFCNFNATYKLTPKTFALWMRILKQVPGSVFWLFKGNNPVFADYIRAQAAKFGVGPEQLAFAEMVLADQNLARLRLADLSLDSLPYNAHTTAADVLWTGVPILTLRGTTWPGRVAASLLHAVGLPELVTETEAEFEAMAVKLARDPAMLATLKQKLAANRLTTPLFDTARWTRHAEAAYAQMYARSQRGEAPTAFAVAPIAETGH
jgi:predicted O-linked N-acetylglucosamine transferase (SPINDLY family)